MRKRKKFTIICLKLWLWICVGVDAMLVSLAYVAERSDWKIALFGAAAMVVQIIHGIRVTVLDKAVVVMLPSFCMFQFSLLLLFMIIIACELGGDVGFTLFLIALFEFVTALIFVLRHRIVEFVRRVFLI